MAGTCRVPSNRLRIAIDTDSRFSSKQSWTETTTLPLQLRLPDVMMSFERWAVIDAEGKEAQRRAEIERRAREAREDALAREAYIQHALGERLVADANQWELSVRLLSYLAEMAARIDQITDPGDRERHQNGWRRVRSTRRTVTPSRCPSDSRRSRNRDTRILKSFGSVSGSIGRFGDPCSALGTDPPWASRSVRLQQRRHYHLLAASTSMATGSVNCPLGSIASKASVISCSKAARLSPSSRRSGSEVEYR